VYNRARLDELLARWRIADFTIVDRAGTTTWVLSDAPRGTAVALVTARK
jgi:hypothetical protein